MTRVTLLLDGDKFYGFKAEGHAGHGSKGNDIVCAAVSVLLINTVNSVDELLHKEYGFDSDEESGSMDFKVTDYDDPEVQLLFRSLELGLKETAKDYPKNLNLTYRRCNP